MKTFILLILFSMLFSIPAYSQQTNREKAQEKMMQAMNMFEEGWWGKAVALLEECCKLVPDDIDYPVEIAYVYYFVGNTDESIERCTKLLKHKRCNERVYSILGSSYHLDKDYEKAEKIYKEGLKKFPNSANLFANLGWAQLLQDKGKQAIMSWEQGIHADPKYPDNYYFLAIYYSLTKEKIWTLLYGEIFLNLERDTENTLDVSKLLYKIYKELMDFNKKGDDVYMSKVSKPETQKFATDYEFISLMSRSDEPRTFSIRYLTEYRKKFCEMWEEKLANDYNLGLMTWHRKLIDNNFFEAYNFWLFQAGNKDEFKTWFQVNEKSFNEFDLWMGNNKIRIDSSSYFSRNKIINTSP